MVDVSGKLPTTRTAETQCTIKLNEEAYIKLKNRDIVKGDPISMAEIAGIMGAKKTSDLVSRLGYHLFRVDPSMSLDKLGLCAAEFRIHG